MQVRVGQWLLRAITNALLEMEVLSSPAPYSPFYGVFFFFPQVSRVFDIFLTGNGIVIICFLMDFFLLTKWCGDSNPGLVCKLCTHWATSLNIRPSFGWRNTAMLWEWKSIRLPTLPHQNSSRDVIMIVPEDLAGIGTLVEMAVLQILGIGSSYQKPLYQVQSQTQLETINSSKQGICSVIS